MLPPSPIAIPAASIAVAAVRICSQCGSTRGRAPRSERQRPQHAGGDAADEPVADLLEHQVRCGARRHRAFVPLGDRERDEEQRHADAVVEAALDVEALPDPRRDAASVTTA